MSKVRKSNRNAILERVTKRCSNNLDRAARVVVRRAKVLVSGPQPPSEPGEPPNKLTGELEESISWDAPHELLRRVGLGLSGAPFAVHGLYLEHGTRNMLPRPWLRVAKDDTREEVASILTSGKQ